MRQIHLDELPPNDMGLVVNGMEPSLEHAGAGSVEIRNPEEGSTLPVDDLPAFHQPLIQGTTAGAGTSRPNIVPPDNTARKPSRKM